MKIKIPLRISFIGGGTDIPPAFIENEGRAISCTIDKYALISTNNELPKLDNYNNLLEAAQKLTKRNISKFKVACEIPPGSGLGTSSAIAVGLCILIYGQVSPYTIAYKSINLERNIAKISGGIQDQFISAFPGINKFKFKGNWITHPVKNLEDLSNIKLDVEVIPYHPLLVNTTELSKHLLLVDTGIIRRQANLMQHQIERTKSGLINNALKSIYNLIEDIEDALITQNWYELGTVIEESWEYKKQLTPEINIDTVDEILTASRNIAYGGKLLGAGAGGYVLLICEERENAYLTMTAKGYRCIKPNIVKEYIIEE